VSKASVERGAVSDFGILRSGKSGGFRWRWRLRTVKTRLTLAVRGSQAYYFVGALVSIMEIAAKAGCLSLGRVGVEARDGKDRHDGGNPKAQPLRLHFFR